MEHAGEDEIDDVIREARDLERQGKLMVRGKSYWLARERNDYQKRRAAGIRSAKNVVDKLLEGKGFAITTCARAGHVLVQAAGGVRFVAARWDKPTDEMEWNYEAGAAHGVSRESVVATAAELRHERWRV